MNFNHKVHFAFLIKDYEHIQLTVIVAEKYAEDTLNANVVFGINSGILTADSNYKTAELIEGLLYDREFEFDVNLNDALTEIYGTVDSTAVTLIFGNLPTWFASLEEIVDDFKLQGRYIIFANVTLVMFQI
jgi:hypothetical protein